MKKIQLVFVLLILVACSPEPADLVLYNGKIVTVTDAVPEAQAIAAKDGKILLIGPDAEVKSYIGPNTRAIDLQGKLVTPGFIEGHGHYAGLGQSLQQLWLMDTKNWDEITTIVKDAVAKAKPGQWITGRGWHQEKWDNPPKNNVDGWPTHNEISKLSPNNPVMLRHASGHSLFANAKAMELAGITRQSKAVAGGDIIKDRRGNPIGIFVDNDMRVFGQLYSAYRNQRSEEEKVADSLEVIKLAAQEALKNGITSFHDAGTSFKWLRAFKKYADRGELDVRLWVMLRDSVENLRKYLPTTKIYRAGNNMLTLGGIKRSLDGALGSRSAWLLEDYSDLKGERGLNLVSMEEMKEVAQLAYDNNLQLGTHAIGDKANREVLNLYEEFFNSHPDKKDWRWRIEHAQHIHPDDIPRFANLGVIPTMQGVHCTSDAPYVPKRLGDERSKSGAYKWKTLWESGIYVVNGTDVPVEDIDPMASFYSSVTRKDRNGNAFYPEEAMNTYQALLSYTWAPARASFELDIKGQLVVGRLADMVVFSKDIMTIDPEEIKTTEVLYTIVGGEVKYEKK